MRPFYFRLLFLCILSLFSCKQKVTKDDPVAGRVIAVKDGDTIKILFHGKGLTVRLAHIDCPEKNQPFGRAAKQFISDKCFGKVVTIRHQNQYDRNNRLIGEVITETGENVNMELVKAGLAWHYKKYSTNQGYSTLEIEARSKHIGLWSEPNPVPPWEWRRK